MYVCSYQNNINSSLNKDVNLLLFCWNELVIHILNVLRTS